MKILKERAEIREHNGMTTLHAEIGMETEKGLRFVQAHDKIGRASCRERV